MRYFFSKKAWSLVVGGVMLLAGPLTLSPLAASADGFSSPDVAALYASGALSDGASNTVHLGGETSATLSSGDSVSLPSSGTGEIHVSSSSGSLGLGLPEGASGAGSTLTPSSTLYGSSNNFSVAATITTSGVREAVTMENPSAPSTYAFPVSLSAGEFLTSNPDGSVSVMKSFSGGSVSVGTFQTPWAKDASGALVPTHYIVQGSTLIQQVEVTSATTFPVVADPTITWGWGAYWNLWGSTIKQDFPIWQNDLNSIEVSLGKLAVGAGFSALVSKFFGASVGTVIGVAFATIGLFAEYAYFPSASVADINRELINIDTSACFQYTLPGNQSYTLWNPQPSLPVLYNNYGFPNSWNKVPSSNCAGE